MMSASHIPNIQVVNVRNTLRAFCTCCSTDWPYTVTPDSTIDVLVCPNCHVAVFGCMYCTPTHYYNNKRKFQLHIATITPTPPLFTKCNKCKTYLVTTLPPPDSSAQIICYTCNTQSCTTQFFNVDCVRINNIFIHQNVMPINISQQCINLFRHH